MRLHWLYYSVVMIANVLANDNKLTLSLILMIVVVYRQRKRDGNIETVGKLRLDCKLDWYSKIEAGLV